ncbi:hypothetical protein V2J94_37045 [Streptomyces sp. DSM 41524]|uniref:Uncharacterized protein n=1 Tax=Streptomyces asiaticus subsp. ignotus TaxID=3098222 RepID=A0ABU7Q7P6_9ACTN|nr:hypothetical protein [Streptomyces sp. DSM 41524]
MINTGAAGPGSRAKRAKADHSARFEAVFLDPVGQTVQQRWEDAALAVAFEDLAPVSAFPAVPGRRWGPGLWWSATTGRHVAAGAVRTMSAQAHPTPGFLHVPVAGRATSVA